MYKFYILLIGLLAVFACSKSDTEINTSIPNCIQDILDQDAAGPNKVLSVIALQKGDNLDYAVTTEDSYVDGPAFILNSVCDTVCYFCGECTEQPECTKEYSDKGQVIWERE